MIKYLACVLSLMTMISCGVRATYINKLIIISKDFHAISYKTSNVLGIIYIQFRTLNKPSNNLRYFKIFC